MSSVQTEGADIDEHEMVVGSAGHDRNTPGHQRVGEHPGVVDDRRRVVPEGRLRRFGQCDGLGCHDVGKRAAQHQRAAAVDELGEFLAAKDKPAAGPRKVLCVVVVTMCAWGTGS